MTRMNSNGSNVTISPVAKTTAINPFKPTFTPGKSFGKSGKVKVRKPKVKYDHYGAREDARPAEQVTAIVHHFR